MSPVIVLLFTAIALGVASRYVPPTVNCLFVETFQAETFHPSINWVQSKNDKYSGMFVVDEPPREKYNHFPGDKMLMVGESHRFYGLSRRFPQALDVNGGKSFVIQYEFRPMDTWDCAGGYLKFFSDPAFRPEAFSGADTYSLMFGPDRCGPEARIHFIVTRPDRKTGRLVEHHLRSPPEPKLDPFTHHYQLVVDVERQAFDIYVDLVNVRNGSLATEFEPPLQPLPDMDDPTDRQPDSWVTQEKIPDASAVKPADWDESQPEFVDDASAVKPLEWDESAPEYIPDPTAIKPLDWNEEEDGVWMHPMIPNPQCAVGGCGKWIRPRIRNPQYRGKWVRPLVDNPAFKGKWKPRRIPNPDYFECPRPLEAVAPLTAVGIEWWTTQKSVGIDNLVIGRSKKALDAFAEATAMKKIEGEQALFKSILGGQGAGEQPKPLQKWKFVAAGVFLVAVIGLFFLLRSCSPSAGAKKPKRE